MTVIFYLICIIKIINQTHHKTAINKNDPRYYNIRSNNTQGSNVQCCLLIPYGVHSHNCTFDEQQNRKFRCYSNFIALFLCLYLPQNQIALATPPTDHMNHSLSRFFFTRPPAPSFHLRPYRESCSKNQESAIKSKLLAFSKSNI